MAANIKHVYSRRGGNPPLLLVIRGKSGQWIREDDGYVFFHHFFTGPIVCKERNPERF